MNTETVQKAWMDGYDAGLAEAASRQSRSKDLLAAVQSLRDECDASSRLIPPALDRDGGARQAFKTVADQLDEIIAAKRPS